MLQQPRLPWPFPGHGMGLEQSCCWSCNNRQLHRENPRLDRAGRDLKITSFHPKMERDTSPQPRLLRAPSELALGTARDEESIALGRWAEARAAGGEMKAAPKAFLGSAAQHQQQLAAFKESVSKHISGWINKQAQLAPC